MTDPDYGSDLACTNVDLDANGRTVTGTKLVCYAIARRITTPRGYLIDDGSYGLSLSDYVSQELSDGQLPRVESEIAAEILKEEPVSDVDVTCTLSVVPSTDTIPRKSMKVSIQGLSAPGPFSLVLDVTELTTALLEAS